MKRERCRECGRFLSSWGPPTCPGCDAREAREREERAHERRERERREHRDKELDGMFMRELARFAEEDHDAE